MFFFPLTPKGRASRKLAKKLYAQSVERAREPVFYESYSVPDSFTGRFEMVTLHAGLLINRVRGEGKDGELLAQSIFDDMFLNMEMACRQSGIGDLSVPKHIKRMMKAVKGRALSYEDAANLGIEELKAALAKNLYATVEKSSDDVLSTIAAYVMECRNGLNNQSFADIQAGQIHFAALPDNKHGVTNVEISQVA